jgi:hypothetical protein
MFTTRCSHAINVSLSHFSVITAHQTPSQAPNPNLSDAIANKSSLFNKSAAPSVGAAPTVLNPPKVINHGKPNLAPRPPPQLKLVTSGNNNSLTGDSNRKTVARHQSMKSPRYITVLPSLLSPLYKYCAFLGPHQPRSPHQDHSHQIIISERCA